VPDSREGVAGAVYLWCGFAGGGRASVPGRGEPRGDTGASIGLWGATETVVGDRGRHPFGPQRRRPTPQPRCARPAGRRHVGIGRVEPDRLRALVGLCGRGQAQDIVGLHACLGLAAPPHRAENLARSSAEARSRPIRQSDPRNLEGAPRNTTLSTTSGTTVSTTGRTGSARVRTTSGHSPERSTEMPRPSPATRYATAAKVAKEAAPIIGTPRTPAG
jgi:hypothetical protein